MSDGSLHKDQSMILHTQSFTKAENLLLSKELNQKFGFHSTVKAHKDIYWVIHIPSKDAQLLRKWISDHMLPEFNYKCPMPNSTIISLPLLGYKSFNIVIMLQSIFYSISKSWRNSLTFAVR